MGSPSSLASAASSWRSALQQALNFMAEQARANRVKNWLIYKIRFFLFSFFLGRGKKKHFLIVVEGLATLRGLVVGRQKETKISVNITSKYAPPPLKWPPRPFSAASTSSPPPTSALGWRALLMHTRMCRLMHWRDMFSPLSCPISLFFSLSLS